MSSSSIETSDHIVHPGGCYLENEFIRCALDESHCHGLEFRSAWRMRESKDPKALRCQRRHPDFVGMCTSKIDKFRCTGHSSGCIISSKFVPNIPYCTVQYNHFPDRDTHLTLYGTCASSGGTECVWSIDDCPGADSGESTFTPATLSTTFGSLDLCTCDKVRTGACVFGENTVNESWMCAVSADACDPSSTFWSWQKVHAKGGDCRLCSDTARTASQVAKGRQHRFNHLNDSGPAGGMTAGVAVGVAAGLLLLNLIVGLWCRRCGRRSASSALESKVESLDAGAIAIEEHDPPVIT